MSRAPCRFERGGLPSQPLTGEASTGVQWASGQASGAESPNFGQLHVKSSDCRSLQSRGSRRSDTASRSSVRSLRLRLGRGRPGRVTTGVYSDLVVATPGSIPNSSSVERALLSLSTDVPDLASTPTKSRGRRGGTSLFDETARVDTTETPLHFPSHAAVRTNERVCGSRSSGENRMNSPGTLATISSWLSNSSEILFKKHTARICKMSSS